jgi:hypothetical protein
MGQSRGLRKRLKGIVKWLFITAGVFYLLTLLIGEVLPPLVRSTIISRASELGLPIQKLTISSVGPSRTELRDIEIGGNGKPAISIAAITIDYSLFELLGGTAGQIMISGAQILPQQLPSMGDRTSQEAGPPGFAVNRLRVLSSQVEIQLPDGSITIPLEADLKRILDSQRYTVKIKALPFGENWYCNGDIDAATGDGELTFKSSAFRLQRWVDALMAGAGYILPSAVTATMAVKISQWELHRATVKGGSSSFAIVLPPYTAHAAWNVNTTISPSLQPEDISAAIEFKSIIGPELEIQQPFTVNITGDSPDNLSIKTNDIAITSPLPLIVREIDGNLKGEKEPVEFTGGYTIELPPNSLAAVHPSLTADRPLAAAGHFAISLPPLESPWHMSGTVGQRLRVTGDLLKSSINRLAVAYALEGNGETIESNILLNAGGLRLTLSDLSITGQKMRMRTAITLSETGWSGSGQLKLLGIDAGIGEHITIHNLSAAIPFQSKRRTRHQVAQTGDFQADSVDIAGLLLEKLVGRLGVGPGVTQAVGRGELPVERLEVNYDGEHKIAGGIDSYSLNFEVPPATLQPNTSLAPLHPFLEGIVASGTVACAGRIEGTGNIFSGTGELRLENFDLAMEEAEVTMAGINGIIRFRDLLGLLSEPAQKLTVRELDIQGIPFRDGRVEFTAEGGGSVLVERGEFELLGGKVFFGGVRAGGEDPVIDTVLYCDRIDFDRLLNVLLGETIASGDAEINGVIPLRLTDDGPLFKQGFLYSSPGIQGALQIQDASLISGGMLLVEEAIRDFNYEWVRVKLNSKNNRLDMSVIIKGVPAAKLPLEYDGKKKDFVRSRTGKRMVTLKGLTLELKFLDIDLGQLLKEGGRVQIMTGK